MRLDDLPRTVVVGGKRQRRRRVGRPPSEIEAYRELLAQAQDVYRQALGCIVMMVNAPGVPTDAVRAVREAGRGFLRAADAHQWTTPAGVKPANQDRRTR